MFEKLRTYGKLVYIPGNHDPGHMFRHQEEGNIHGRAMELADDLLILGLGGSIQDYVQKNGEGPLVPCWDAFPYKEEDHSRFNQELATLWALSLDFKGEVILMTHEGPQLSSTSKNQYFWDNNTTYVAGSPALRELMLANSEKITCNIHGHLHDGAFYQNLWKPHHPLPIINPGSLKQSEFGELELEKKDGKWKVK